MKSDADPDFRKAFFVQFIVDAEHAPLHGHGGVDSILRVLGRDGRGTEQGHQSVTQILVERSAVGKDDVSHR